MFREIEEEAQQIAEALPPSVEPSVPQDSAVEEGPQDLSFSKEPVPAPTVVEKMEVDNDDSQDFVSDSDSGGPFSRLALAKKLTIPPPCEGPADLSKPGPSGSKSTNLPPDPPVQAVPQGSSLLTFILLMYFML